MRRRKLLQQVEPLSVRFPMPEMSKKSRQMIDDAVEIWRDLHFHKSFVTVMLGMGWLDLNGQYGGTSKQAVYLPGCPVVLKWDHDPRIYRAGWRRWNNRYRNQEWHYTQRHTWAEWRRWNSIKPELRHYLAPIYAHHEGLIIQKRIQPCEDCMIGQPVPKRIRQVALALHTSHWWHHSQHGKSGQRLQFFDYDSNAPYWGTR